MHRMMIFLVTSLLVFAGMTTLTPQSVCAKLLEDAVGIWFLDEGSGKTVGDSSGNGNNGTIRGDGGKWADGKFGKALLLNGTTEFVEVPDSASLDLQEQVTMVCWFNWEGSGDGWQTFFSKGPMSGTNENYALFTNSANRHTHFCKNAGGARDCFNSPNNAFESKQWVHAAATYDGKTQITYIDGKEVAKGNISGKMVPNNNYLGIGFREGSPHYWKGMLDDMAIFKRALSADEVKGIMEKGLSSIVVAVHPKDKLATMWGRIKEVR
ncbi:LamG domain-containing protein [Candidatus Poribacteria bacterium]|nr:LamG domain-containing protein [Candidatus Poribacteria bacterium]